MVDRQEQVNLDDLREMFLLEDSADAADILVGAILEIVLLRAEAEENRAMWRNFNKLFDSTPIDES